jgi:hypothetical protein
MKKESASSFLTEILSFLKRERERDFANLRTVYHIQYERLTAPDFHRFMDIFKL